MRFTHFTLAQNSQDIGSFPSRDLAVSEAARRAADTYRPVAVIAHAEDGSTREAVFNPDGTNQNIWLIDKGKPLVPTFGQIYLNRGGGAFRCIGEMSSATALYYNQAGGSSNTVARFRNIISGWTFVAKGIIQYCDGTIEWDRSTDGHFAGKDEHRDD